MTHQCLFLVSHNLTIKSDTSCTMSMRTEQGRRDEVTLFKLKQKTFVLELQWGKSKGFILKTNPPLAFLELFSLKAVPKWEITSDMGQCQGAQRRAGGEEKK